MSAPRVNRRRAAVLIAERAPFTNSSLRGRSLEPGEHVERGRLPAASSAALDSATYVIYSYATPIAWWSEEHGWRVPEESYSQTTGRHQRTVREAIQHKENS